MATYCIPAFNPNIATLSLTVRSLNCFSRINNRTRVCFYILRQIGLKTGTAQQVFEWGAEEECVKENFFVKLFFVKFIFILAKKWGG